MEQYMYYVIGTSTAIWALGVWYFVRLMFDKEGKSDERTVLHNLVIVALCLTWPISVPITLLIAWNT